MGLFNREAVAVDSVSGIVYQTEIVPTACSTASSPSLVGISRLAGHRIDIEAQTNVGHAVPFKADITHGVTHGVTPIDPNHSERWLHFRGRCMRLIIVRKLHDSTDIASAVDLDRKD